MKNLTVEAVMVAERALRENNVPPPYVLRTTKAGVRRLLKSAMKTEGAYLSSAVALSQGAPALEPGEMVVSRVGDTFIVVRGS